MEHDIFDVTIIGGGPTGLFAAFYAGLRGMRTRIIDSLEQLGGQLTTLYPDKFIYDVAGFPAVLSRTLVTELIRQVSQYKPTISLGEQVLRLNRRDDGTFRLETDRGDHPSRSVIIAAGAGAFTPKRLPGVSLDEYDGKGVSYFVRDISAFRGKRVLVIGGGGLGRRLVSEPAPRDPGHHHDPPGRRVPGPRGQCRETPGLAREAPDLPTSSRRYTAAIMSPRRPSTTTAPWRRRIWRLTRC